MDAPAHSKEVLLQLLEQSSLAGPVLDSFFKQAVSADYWRELNPQLTLVGDLEGNLFEEATICSQHQQQLVEKFSLEGYFRLDSLLSKEMMARMRNGVDVVRQQGWPPVFAFVYDEFWSVWRSPTLTKLLSQILGAGYRRVRHHLWCHYVPAHARSSGWPPHMDGYPGRVTAWIALSEARLENGCMYLVPENLTPERIRGRYRQEDTFSLSEMDALLQNTRALPVEAGSVLVWNDKVIHWGATCVEPDEPRISISFELTGEDADRKDETSNGDDYITELNERLYVIGRAVRSYVRFEPLMKRYSSLAERLIDLKNR